MVMQYKPYGYSAENDPINVGLKNLREGMDSLANSKYHQAMIDELSKRYESEYGDQSLSGAYVDSLPEPLKAQYKKEQARQAPPEERLKQASGQLGDNFFNSEDPQVGATDYQNPITLPKAEHQDLRELVKNYRTAKSSGSVFYGTRRQADEAYNLKSDPTLDPNELVPLPNLSRSTPKEQATLPAKAIPGMADAIKSGLDPETPIPISPYNLSASKTGANRPTMKTTKGAFAEATGWPLGKNDDPNESIEVYTDALVNRKQEKKQPTLPAHAVFGNDEAARRGLDPNEQIPIAPYNMSAQTKQKSTVPIRAIIGENEARKRGIDPEMQVPIGDQHLSVANQKKQYTMPAAAFYGGADKARAAGVDPESEIPIGNQKLPGAPGAKPDPNRVDPRIGAWFDSKKPSSEFPNVSEIGGLSARENALLNQRIQQERNDALRSQQQSFHADTIKSQAAGRAQTENHFQAQEYDKKKATAKELQPIYNGVERMNRMTDVARMVREGNIDLGLQARGQLGVETGKTFFTGGDLSENSQKLRDLEAITSADNVKQVYENSGKQISENELKRYARFQINPVFDNTPDKIRAKLRGFGRLLHDDLSSDIKALETDKPVGTDKARTDFIKAYDDFSKEVGSSVIDKNQSPGRRGGSASVAPQKPLSMNASDVRKERVKVSNLMKEHPEVADKIKARFKERTGQNY